MRLNRTFFGFTFGLIVLLIACGTSSANGLITLEFDLDVTMQYPVDVSMNPTEDPSKIAGFCSQNELLYEGIKIGDLSGCWMLKKPFDPTRLYDDIDVSGTLVVTGIGQCSLTGQAIAMAIGEDPSLGNLAVRLISRLTDCTESLAGIEGLVEAGGTSNLYDQTSDQYKMTMHLQYFPQ